MAKSKKKTQKSKWEVLAAVDGDEIYVGIDVHKKSYHIAVWKNGQEVATWVIAPGDRELVKRLRQAGSALKKVVYEAGPTGYGLARCLLDAELPGGVVAPGKTPKEANPGNKSDKIDCRRLAEYAAKDLLKYIEPPTEEEDADRQLVRLRDATMKKRKRTMQQIKSFLLYNSIPEPAGLTHWSHSAIVVLEEMKLPPRLRFCLDEYLRELAYHNHALKRVEEALKEYEKEHAEEMTILKSHPGVGSTTARQILAEIYQPGRFETDRQVAAYVGLAPKIKESGQTRLEGGVIKGGRGVLRSMLVECCWIWIRKDEAAYQRYLRHCQNTGSAQKSIHAMGRHLLVNLWNMLNKKEEYRNAA